jgi:hypothetical protein
MSECLSIDVAAGQKPTADETFLAILFIIDLMNAEAVKVGGEFTAAEWIPVPAGNLYLLLQEYRRLREALE